MFDSLPSFALQANEQKERKRIELGIEKKNKQLQLVYICDFLQWDIFLFFSPCSALFIVQLIFFMFSLVLIIVINYVLLFSYFKS